MTVTQESVDQFHEFARQQLKTANSELSWDELLITWQSACERDATNAAIREALNDIDADRVQTSEEAMEEIRLEFGFDE